MELQRPLLPTWMLSQALALESPVAYQTGLVPVIGTWSSGDAWANDPQSPFQKLVTARNFYVVRDSGGEAFWWDGFLDGLVRSKYSRWISAAYGFREFVLPIPYHHRNIVAHSHGGNVVLVALARYKDLKIRSLTTVGTPVREGDVDGLEAAKRIGYWQHIYDDTFDLMGTLGGWLDGKFSQDRSFAYVPSVVRRPMHGIDHSKVLRDESYVPRWVTEGWLYAIQFAGGQEAA